MSTAELKYTLHNLIDVINDSKTLNAIYALISKKKKKDLDWWNTISAEEKKAIETGLKQLKDGKGIPHKEVRKKVDRLLSK